MKSHRTNLFDRLIGYIETVPASDRLLLRIGFFAVVASLIFLGFAINDYYSEDTPVPGGTITEGIVGTPRFVNPVLAQTRADQDVTTLVYGGLLKINSNGELENDIAEEIITSTDGLTYSIKIRRDVSFHDGNPLTARDVAYTIQLIQDPDLKSPLRGNWSGVVVEEVGEYELNIILEEAYAPFTENFTVGIMPAHIWSELPIEQIPFSQLNTEPIGSGPFRVSDAKRDTSGIINHYTLTPHKINEIVPKIDTLELAFFQNEEELLAEIENNTIDATAYVSAENITAELESNYAIFQPALPRTFGIFFNQNKSTVLRDATVREALTAAINRDVLIEKALFGYGVPISLPTTLVGTEIKSGEDTSTSTAATNNKEQAISILEDGGWEINELGLWAKEVNDEPVTLSLTLKTSNSPLFNQLVAIVTEQWTDIGVEVTVEQYEQTGLVQSVIRTRDFQALLFGVDMNRSQDLYPFWHSSQKDDPGLNVAEYTNLTVDDLLETARVEQNEVNRNMILSEAGVIIAAEQPAIFLFQPQLIYMVKSEIVASVPHTIVKPADRFTQIVDWHTESQRLWPIFRTNDE